MLKTILQLLRVNQYYKNLLIFLPLIFAKEFLDLKNDLLVLLGFISLCFISSANYIINDIVDRKVDVFHPEKKLRPIASGKVKLGIALVLFFLLLISSLSIARFLSFEFFIITLILFLFTLLYSLILKKELFLDIISIGINFVLRAVSGAFIINVTISPWLMLCPFFLSLFLATAKRKADSAFIGKEATKHKQVLKSYSDDITNSLMIITTTLLIVSYSLYVFFSKYHLLFLTLPFALYSIFRYYSLIYTNSHVARKPETLYKDFKLVLSIVLLAIITILLIYFS